MLPQKSRIITEWAKVLYFPLVKPHSPCKLSAEFAAFVSRWNRGEGLIDIFDDSGCLSGLATICGSARLLPMPFVLIVLLRIVREAAKWC